MCGLLDDRGSFSDLLFDSDDDFDLSASIYGSLSNSPHTRSISQNALEFPREFELELAMDDELDDHMLNTDDTDTSGPSQIECKWNCEPAISELRSRAIDAPATVALEQDTTMCVGHGKAVSSAQYIGNFFIAYIHRLAISLTSVRRIEALVVDFLEQLAAALPSTEEEVKDALCGKFKNPKKLELRLTDRKKLSNDGAFGIRTQTFPKGVRGSIVPFAQFFRIADLAHEAMTDGLPATKRDLFYRDVQLFKKQSVVDKLVDDLAATIDTTRAQLNIVNKRIISSPSKFAIDTPYLKRASPKGLICGGGLSIRTIRGEVIHVTESEGTLIPVAEDIASLDISNNVSWVLVIEKEAVFQTLRQLCFVRCPMLQRGTGVIITGKGYPDLATRQMVKMLSDNIPSTVPFVMLVDGDAYGLDIASVYKFGSVTLRHESHGLAVPRIECIGVWASELASFGIDKCELLPISRADEKKARSMLRRELPDRWKKELVHMLFTRRKAETEILSSVSCISGEPHPLAKYLADKIRERILASAWQHTSGVSTADDVGRALFDEF